ncbi:MAG: SUMF1/EgtB/PvdO family nonheme iron enzyme [Polyangiaceae bacterium]
MRLSGHRALGALAGLLLLACNRNTAPNEAGELPLDPGEPVAQNDTKSLVAVLSPRVVVPEVKKGEPACPDGMALVEGDYCPEVQHQCLKYMDPPGRYENFRCAEYAQPARCTKPRKHMRFCIDKYEFVEKGQSLPANYRSFTHAEQACGALGKRVCMESEYNFACEGEEMRPYPYGFSRDATACNADHYDVVGNDGKLRDMRAPAGAYPRCESPFGVYDLAGNLEEFVAIDGSNPVRPAMKGAYWQPSRNHCRAAQTAHDRYYNGTETGFRCCSNAPN